MRRAWERSYPYLIAAACAGAFWWCKLAFPSERDILGASVTLGAVFVGFLSTAEAIVVSLQGPIAERFRSTRFYDLLLLYTQEAIGTSILYCVASLIGYFLPDEQPPALWYALAWVFLTAASLATFYRVSRILINLVRASGLSNANRN